MAKNKKDEIDFDGINAIVLGHLEAFLAEELPDGQRKGNEWVAINPTRVDAKSGSFSINMNSCVWSDFATGDSGGDPVSLYAYIHDIKQGAAAKELGDRYGTMTPTTNKKKTRPRITWTPVLPVPDDAPDPPAAHYHYGKPSVTWEYPNAAGRLLGYIWRFDRPGKSKEIVPLTYCKNKKGKYEWRFRSWEVPRPIYGLDSLATNPDATVLIVEGEKCKVAAADHFQAAISWPGGGKAVKKVDWTPLDGRKIVIWPDNHGHGYTTALEIYELIHELAVEVKIIDTTDVSSKEWDIADVVAEGWTRDQLREYVKQNQLDVDQYRRIVAGPVLDINSKLIDDAEKIAGAKQSFSFTDTGNARRLVHLFGDEIRFNTFPFSKWFVWDGRRWCEDQKNAIYNYVDKVVSSIHEEAAKADSDERKRLGKWALSLESMNRQRQMVSKAQTLKELQISIDELDCDPYLFNVRNCTLDLSSGDDIIERPHSQGDNITKLANVDYVPDAACPGWLKFLGEIFKGNEDVIPFLQKAIGYSLTGVVSEQVLFFCYGTGANGKSVFFNAIEAILGDYFGKAPSEMIMQQKFSPVPTDVADLKGKRFVVCAEIEDNKRFAEARVKDLTGGDTITARRMREDYFVFRPTHKLFIYGNHKPVIYGNDTGIWRRIRIIPFTVTIPPENRVPQEQLHNEFLSEANGILNWALEGYLSYRENGFCDPPTVMEAAADYRSEMDMLGAFLGECCIEDIHATKIAKILWEKYHGWCESRGEHHLGYNRWCSKMRERGIDVSPGAGNKMCVNGFELVQDEHEGDPYS